MSNPSLVLEKVGELKFENRPIPQLTDSRFVKVAIKKTGICGSDIHYYTHGSIGDFVVKKPMVLGHESSGVIVEVGDEVTSVKVGDRVAIEPGIPSRFSKEYKEGRYNLCPHMAFAATPPYDGTLARYYLVPEDFVYKLPENVSLEDGALAEPLSVAVHSCKLGGVKFGDTVAVFGGGPVGLLVASTARAFGAKNVLVVDIFDKKLELAKKMGATHVYNSLKVKEDFVEGVVRVLGVKPNVIIEASGAEIAINNGIKLVAAGGTYVQVGMGKDRINNFNIGAVAGKELTVKGNFRYCHGDYEDAIELLASGKVNAKLVVSHRFKFDEAIKAYETNVATPQDVIKTIIDGPEDLSSKL